MIGNEIKFWHYINFNNDAAETRTERVGLVVDTFTKPKAGSNHLNEIWRMYKIQYFNPYIKKNEYFDIMDWQLIEIIKFK